MEDIVKKMEPYEKKNTPKNQRNKKKPKQTKTQETFNWSVFIFSPGDYCIWW